MTEPQSGQEILHYRVLRKLGQGGMGAVYMAEDTKLQRRVALKFLPAEMISDTERLRRFEREAQAVAALNHPNIVTIYSVEEDQGVPFIAMELVDGKSLSELIPNEGLSLAEFFELAIPIADAVSTAHEKGITHRDLKPGNIMVGSDGRVKVLDFGLAKLLQNSEVGDATSLSTQTLTKTGNALGTVTYMAPEQLKGKSPDQRADIFSLGIVFYQMSSGQRPFKGETSAEVISSILRDAPPPVTELKIDLPSHLGRIVKRCLEKNPSRRYQTAAELRNELEELKHEVDSGTVFEEDAKTKAIQVQRASRRTQVTTVAVGAAVALVALIAILWAFFGRSKDQLDETATGLPLRTIAVLPFSSIGGDPDQTFTEGLNEELSSVMTSLPNLQVVSRATARQQFMPEVTTQQVGEALGADFLVLGSVRWDEPRDETSTARTTLQVVRVEDDIQIWSDSWDRQLSDELSVQSEIAQHLARAVGSTVLELPDDQLPPAPEDLASPLVAQEAPSAASKESSRAPPRATPPKTAPSPSSTAPVSRVTKIEETVPPPEDSSATAPSITLAMELTTFAPVGVLTVYADDLQVLREDFEFAGRKKGILGRKKAAGTFTAQHQVPVDTRSLRVYILVDNETKLVTLEPQFSIDSSPRLEIALTRKGVLEATLR